MMEEPEENLKPVNPTVLTNDELSHLDIGQDGEYITPTNPVVTVETVTEIPGGGSQSVTLINLEQCSICSTFYEQVKRAIPQPDLNRLICKLLEIQPGGTQEESQAFFANYIPICTECAQKVRKYDKLRVELEVMKNDVVSSVVDTLVHIRPNGNTPIHGVKDQIFKRWSTVKVGNSEVTVASIAPKPVKAFVIKPADQYQEGQTSKKILKTNTEKIQPLFSSHTDGTSTENTVSHWIYTLDASQIDPNNPNLTVAEEVIVSTPDEFSEFQNDNANDTNEDREYFSVNDEDWFIKPIGPPDSKRMKSSKNFKEKNQSSANKFKRLQEPKDSKKEKVKHHIPPYFCDDCGRVFGKWATFRLHGKNCTKDASSRTKLCPLCSINFSSGSWQDFKQHFDDVHPNSELERCITCRMDFLPTTLLTHVCGFKAVDYANMGADFKCDICSKAYVTRSNLTDHIRRTHYDEAKVTCDSCNKTYSSKMLLEEHMKTHSRAMTRFQCKVCGSFSTSSWGLKQHMRIHTGELPFQCKICDKSFRCGSVLKNHEVTHTKQKNFPCEICGKKFGLQGTMTRHWKRHQLPDTNFTKKCPLCPNLKFKKVWVLRKHMVMNHMEGSPEYETFMKKYQHIDDRPKSQLRLTDNCVNDIELDIKVETTKLDAPNNKSKNKRGRPVFKKVCNSKDGESENSPKTSIKSEVIKSGFSYDNSLEQGGPTLESVYGEGRKSPHKSDERTERSNKTRKRQRKSSTSLTDSSSASDVKPKQKLTSTGSPPSVKLRVSTRQTKKPSNFE